MIDVVIYSFASGVMPENERHCAFLVRIGTDKKTGTETRKRLPMVFFASDSAQAAMAARSWWETETAKVAAKVERGRTIGKQRRAA